MRNTSNKRIPYFEKKTQTPTRIKKTEKKLFIIFVIIIIFPSKPIGRQ